MIQIVNARNGRNGRNAIKMVGNPVKMIRIQENIKQNSRKMLNVCGLQSTKLGDRQCMN